MLVSLGRSINASRGSSKLRYVRSISSYYSYFPKTIPNGPPPRGPFDIDLKQLRAEYITAQQQSHPDVAGNDSHVNSAELGVAYRTLRDPVSRGEHILALQNANPLEEGAPATGGEELVLETYMMYQQVEEAETVEELQTVREKNTSKWEAVLKQMGDALEQGDIKAAQLKLVELTYWTRIKGAIDQRQEEISSQ